MLGELRRLLEVDDRLLADLLLRFDDRGETQEGEETLATVWRGEFALEEAHEMKQLRRKKEDLVCKQQQQQILQKPTSLIRARSN